MESSVASFQEGDRRAGSVAFTDLRGHHLQAPCGPEDFLDLSKGVIKILIN